MIMDRFYNSGSAREPGTLYHLKSVINRRNVSSTVTKDYHADSAFIDLVGESHIISLALTHFGMADLNAPCKVFPHGIHLADIDHKKRILRNLVGELVDSHIMNILSQTLNREQLCEDENNDRIYNYATNFLKFWLLRKISIVATRSGDGMRILRHWKYAMLLYHIAHKTKYRLEAFLLIACTIALFTPRQQHQVIWNRFVNLSGGRGKNLDGDYVMELLNKYAKARVKLIGPNHSHETVLRIGKTMMFCHDISRNLECQVGAAPISRDHKAQDTTGDLTKLVRELQRANVFTCIPGRAHNSFQNEPSDIFTQFNVIEFHKWMNAKKKQYAGNKQAF
ncbi:uncharacterized protein LOC133185634 [Saccostrea echinata]|uniref:uncharacterized protein LOC133185634 n=1 Tax=Saccostrea echinata TaxID=191078 RepID=UPI002A82F2B8|nr:uncharacterized protein LOC133185634 [Saccostrea echinata]